VAIYFVCPCGKDLRADDSRAGGQMQCPACRRPLSVPSLQSANPAFDFTAFPLLQNKPPGDWLGPAAAPSKRQRKHPPRQAGPSPPPAAPPNEDDDRPYPVAAHPHAGLGQVRDEHTAQELERLFSRAREEETRRHKEALPWPREKNWLQCLLFPLRAWKLLFGLTAAWSLATAVALGTIPDEVEQHGTGALWAALVLVLPLFGYTWAFLRIVLVSACRGEAGIVARPGRDAAWAGSSIVLGMVCSLTGPIIPLAVAVLFWFNGGDLRLVDWLILEELGTLAVANWALALAAFQDGGRAWDAGPIGVARLVGRLGLRTTLGVFLASAPVAGLALLLLAGLDEPGPIGWLLVIVCWAGILFGLVFLLRWLGLTCFRARKKRGHPKGKTPVTDRWGGADVFLSPADKL
jgi:hypothetical protein